MGSKMRDLMEATSGKMVASDDTVYDLTAFYKALVAGTQALVVTTGGLTDTELRVAAVPVSGPLTDTELRVAAVAIVGQSVQSSASVTRPADTTQYAVDDVLANSTSAPVVLTFAGVGRAVGALGYILGGTMVTSTAAATAAMVRLLLFSAAPTAVNDNAALSLSDAHALLCVGWLTFDMWQDTANNRVYVARLEGQAPQFDCAAAATAIYGIPVLQNAYTPGSEEVFTFTLHVSQD